MGKIIQFTGKRKSTAFELEVNEEDFEKWKGHPEGVKLYFQLFKHADGKIQEYIYSMIGWDLIHDWDSRCYIKAMDATDALSIIGYATAKAIRNTTKDTAIYHEKLAEFINKYGLEELRNAKA